MLCWIRLITLSFFLSLSLFFLASIFLVSDWVYLHGVGFIELKTVSETFFKTAPLQPSKHRFRLRFISRQLLSNFKTPTVNSVLIISPCIILMSPCIVRNMIVWSNKRLKIFSFFICWISVSCTWHSYSATKCIWLVSGGLP